MLGHLVAAEHGADAHANGPGVRQPAAPDLVGDPRQRVLGGGQQGIALAPPLLGQRRIAADNQALARIVGAADLGQIALVEQRQLQRPAVGQGADRRRPQRGDPPAGSSSSRMRALVIRPRSPIRTTWASLKRRFSRSTWTASVFGSLVSPENTSTATGQPSAAQSRP
jgi:hypothetical protein